MLWRGRRQSDNVSDRRGLGMGGALLGGGSLVAALIYAFITGDLSVLQNTTNKEQEHSTSTAQTEGKDEQREFIGVVLADTEDVWKSEFENLGKIYREPELVLFSSAVSSACGQASSAIGPFYCGQDQKVYLDLNFFQVLRSKLKAGGDFAQAYVIAHEVGHHVQNLLGLFERSQHLGEGSQNEASVQVELQADCFAGVWAKATDNAKQVLEAGDLEEALTAAQAVGDDTLQQRTQGYVVPDSFTHGTSEQRMRAFQRGFDGGRANACLRTVAQANPQ